MNDRNDVDPPPPPPKKKRKKRREKDVKQMDINTAVRACLAISFLQYASLLSCTHILTM